MYANNEITKRFCSSGIYKTIIRIGSYLISSCKESMGKLWKFMTLSIFLTFPRNTRFLTKQLHFSQRVISCLCYLSIWGLSSCFRNKIKSRLMVLTLGLKSRQEWLPNILFSFSKPTVSMRVNVVIFCD